MKFYSKFTEWIPSVYNTFSDEIKKGAFYKCYIGGYIIYIRRESKYNKRYKLDREYLATEKYYENNRKRFYKDRKAIYK